jgi:hypothetical protein
MRMANRVRDDLEWCVVPPGRHDTAERGHSVGVSLASPHVHVEATGPAAPWLHRELTRHLRSDRGHRSRPGRRGEKTVSRETRSEFHCNLRHMTCLIA